MFSRELLLLLTVISTVFCGTTDSPTFIAVLIIAIVFFLACIAILVLLLVYRAIDRNEKVPTGSRVASPQASRHSADVEKKINPIESKQQIKKTGKMSHSNSQNNDDFNITPQSLRKSVTKESTKEKDDKLRDTKEKNMSKNSKSKIFKSNENMSVDILPPSTNTSQQALNVPLNQGKGRASIPLNINHGNNHANDQSRTSGMARSKSSSYNIRDSENHDIVLPPTPRVPVKQSSEAKPVVEQPSKNLEPSKTTPPRSTTPVPEQKSRPQEYQNENVPNKVSSPAAKQQRRPHPTLLDNHYIEEDLGGNERPLRNTPLGSLAEISPLGHGVDNRQLYSHNPIPVRPVYHSNSNFVPANIYSDSNPPIPAIPNQYVKQYEPDGYNSNIAIKTANPWHVQQQLLAQRSYAPGPNQVSKNSYDRTQVYDYDTPLQQRTPINSMQYPTPTPVNGSNASSKPSTDVGGVIGDQSGNPQNSAMSSVKTTKNSVSSSQKSTEIPKRKTEQTLTLQTNTAELSVPGFLEVDAKTDYKLLKKIARGGEATLYRSEIFNNDLKERAQQHPIAIKVFNGEVDERRLLAMAQEVALMWYLRDCPQVAKIVGFARDPPVILMRYYAFGSLKNFIEKGSIMRTKRNFMRLLMDVSQGLRKIHSCGIVHADIKSANILLDKSEDGLLHAYLSDFGISQIVDDVALLVHEFHVVNLKGVSVPYASPEVLAARSDRKKRPRVNYDRSLRDIYSFAVVMYEAITRIRAWDKY